MSRIHLDENIAREIRTRLVALGHDAIENRDIVGASASDHVHIAAATRYQRVLLTSNERDFRLLHHAWKDWFAEWGAPPLPEHAGIMVIPQPPHLLSARAAVIINDYLMDPSKPIRNRLIVFDAGGEYEIDPPARR